MDEECDRLTETMGGQTRVRYDPPDIKEILVDGDLAAVRLTWTAHIADDGGSAVEVERGLDVFERGDDGCGGSVSARPSQGRIDSDR